MGNSGHRTDVGKLHGEEEEGFAKSLLAERDGYKLLKYILEAALFEWLRDFGHEGYGREFITACEHLGVDVPAIEKKIADEKKVKATKAPAKKKAKKTKGKK